MRTRGQGDRASVYPMNFQLFAQLYGSDLRASAIGRRDDVKNPKVRAPVVQVPWILRRIANWGERKLARVWT